MRKVEIIKKSDREYWVGENKTFVIEENIVFIIAKGEQTDELAAAQGELCDKLMKELKKVKFLIDLNSCEKNSPKARLTWKRFSNHANTEKSAVFGIHPVAKVLASFVIGLKATNRERFFNTKGEALAWLQEK